MSETSHQPPGKKPFGNLPPDATKYFDALDMKQTLIAAARKMLDYQERYPEPKNKVYQNCNTMLRDGFRDGVSRMFAVEGFIVEHENQIQGMALITSGVFAVTIDYLTVAPWNIVPPPDNRLQDPNPYRGAGQQIVYQALLRSEGICGAANVDLNPISAEAAESFAKMGFVTKDGGKRLVYGKVGVLKGENAKTFMKKIADRKAN